MSNPKQTDEASQPEEPSEIKKSKRTMKTEVDTVVNAIEKDQIDYTSHESVDSEELTEASKDADQTMDPFTENLEEGSKAYGAETKAAPELETNPDKRFSKKHEIDEEALRKNKQKNAGSGS